jgi:hypothetical protein
MSAKLSRLLWSDAAVCCYLLVVALLLPAQGLCTTGTGCKACLIASTHANKHAYAHYSMLCNSIGQLQLSAGCSEYCRMQGLAGFVQQQQPNTGWACLTASTHANRHAHIQCSAALTVQLRLFAIYSGYCRMHRVCAACLETRYSLQGPLYRRNTFK